MQTNDLAHILSDIYRKAPSRDKAVSVVLFGIKYSKELQTQSTAEIAELAGIGKWGPQIALGRKLAEHVQIEKP